MTLLLKARPYTPTDKPRVEGAFGLFKAGAPPLQVSLDSLEQLAMDIVRLVVIIIGAIIIGASLILRCFGALHCHHRFGHLEPIFI